MNRKRTAPLPEYPGTEPALIEPSRTRPKGVRIPSRAVLCFFGDLLRELVGRPEVKVVHRYQTEIGEQPILRIGRGKKAVAIMHPGIGAPLAGTTWTTDGVFRETPRKIRSRRQEGCLTVEMEAATFFAVARFRGIRFGQLLYAGDDVSGEEWDPRRWEGRSATREQLLMLAIEAARNLSP